MTTTLTNPEPSGQALPAGTRIEEFVIERVLGSGGFGITYLARDVSLGRQVVIKENLPVQFCYRDTHSLTVAPRHTTGEDVENFKWSLENFSKEATMVASLDHPGIVKVLRSFEAFGTLYFAMPFVDGVALDELSKQRDGKPFSEVELRGLLERMLAALSYLHARGIYHRDIKPANILITNDGIPVLIDFGSARQQLSERSMTVVESAGYTPFEQLQSRGNVGPWSDLYALAATVIKGITHVSPPKATDRIRNDPHVPLADRPELVAAYSVSLLQSIDRAFQVDEEKRFQGASEWTAALSSGPESKTPSTRKPSIVSPAKKLATASSPLSSRTIETRNVKNHNAKFWAVGGLLAVLTIGVLVLQIYLRDKPYKNRTARISDTETRKDPDEKASGGSDGVPGIAADKKKQSGAAVIVPKKPSGRAEDIPKIPVIVKDAPKAAPLIPLTETEATAIQQQVHEFIVQKWYDQAYALCSAAVDRLPDPATNERMKALQREIVSHHLIDLAARKYIPLLRNTTTYYEGETTVTRVGEIEKSKKMLERYGEPVKRDLNLPYLEGESVWEKNDNGYVIEKLIQIGNCAAVRKGSWKNGNLTIPSGCVVLGGTLLASGGSLVFKGTAEIPVVVIGCQIQCDYTATVSATHTVFVDCSFMKTGGWTWNGGFSAKWSFSSCVLYRSNFKSLGRKDVGLRLINSRAIQCRFPARTMTLTDKVDAKSELRAHWNTISKCYFDKCSLDSSFVWSTGDCVFDHCEIVGEARKFSSSKDFVVNYSVTEESPGFADRLRATTLSTGSAKIDFIPTKPGIEPREFTSMMPFVPRLR